MDVSEDERIHIRPAVGSDAFATADVYLASRAANLGSIPAGIHEDEDVRQWFAGTLMTQADVWVATRGKAILGFLAMKPGWIDHLYLAPDATGNGLGSRFVELAKSEQPAGLDLWTFQSNAGARSFYMRHGFIEVARTDGDNEEGEPDVRCAWRPTG